MDVDHDLSQVLLRAQRLLVLIREKKSEGNQDKHTQTCNHTEIYVLSFACCVLMQR